MWYCNMFTTMKNLPFPLIGTTSTENLLYILQLFHYKHTKAVIVLKGLKKVLYTLFAESDDGLIAVAPSEANAHKKLHVSWNKTK